jgi:anti-sigma factor RsiW
MSQYEEFQNRPTACAVCEAMLPEAVDGTLSEAEQRAFDKHVAGCVECANELAEAKRGAAWLGMLKTRTPEPPARLLAKILAETTGGAQPISATIPATSAVPVAAQPVWETLLLAGAGKRQRGWSTQWAALRAQVGEVFSIESARATFQPRLAMTAAMAFFSIALTLNLTGVKLSNLRASSFTPSALQRTAADASASATRMFQNNRTVYQVESRLSELRSDDAPGIGTPAARR